jgi:HEAT repeat protein
VAPLLEVLGAADAETRAAAARALAEFADPETATRVADIARQSDQPMIRRLSAIDSLSFNVHRREIVRALFELLELDSPEISARAMSALESATTAPLGTDRAQWRTWWLRVSAMDEQQWLTEQLQINRDRALTAQSELEVLREQSRRHESALAARLTEMLRDEFRALPVEQRDARLAERLKEPLPEVVLGAMEVIKGRLADEGKRPEGLILTALISLLKDGSPAIRREAVVIIQNSSEPAVTESLLARLSGEDDVATRLAVLRALGKQGGNEVVSALIREIKSANSAPDIVREAALALGLVAGRVGAASPATEAVVPLKSRYGTSLTADPGVRSALLTAMAAIADTAFLTEFLNAVDSDEPGLLRPAIRGLSAIGDTSRLARLRALTSDKDTLVRIAAVEAVGLLGREEADIEALLARMNPAAEPNETAREAAWVAFGAWQKRRSPTERTSAAERLKDMPELQARYLEQLMTDASQGSVSVKPDLEIVRERLAAVYVHLGKFSSALPHLRELYSDRVSRGELNAFETGLRLLEATLHVFSPGELAELIKQLHAACPDDSAKSRIASLVGHFADGPDTSSEPDRARKLLAELRSIQSADPSPHWADLIERLNTRTEETANSGVRSSP